MTDRRRILITGATSGIGFAVAQRLASTDDVWIMGSRPETAHDAVYRLREAGVSVIGATGVDAADEDAVNNAVDTAVAAMGGLDGVFINAGMDGQAVPARELGVEGFRRLLDVNVVGPFIVAKAAIRHLSRPGTIVFNSSANAVRPEVHFLDYNASKAAVASMAATLALELSAEGVSVISLAPGYFPTRMTEAYLNDPEIANELMHLIPAKRFGTLTEVAEVVDFLLSPSARFMTGSMVNLDGGRSI